MQNIQLIQIKLIEELFSGTLNYLQKIWNSELPKLVFKRRESGWDDDNHDTRLDVCKRKTTPPKLWTCRPKEKIPGMYLGLGFNAGEYTASGPGSRGSLDAEEPSSALGDPSEPPR